MKHIIFFLLTFALVVPIESFGQQLGPNISFESTSHNYGQLKENDGIAKHKFIFTNTGSQPLIVQNVKPSCGCTSSDWTKNPIPPGGEGYVTAEYNPKNRPGKFSKSIRVTTNAEPSTTILRINGVVEEKEKTIAELYPGSVGDLRMKTSHLAFMNVYNDEKKVEQLEVINNGSNIISVEFKNIPNFITLSMEPNSLKPKETTSITVTYDASMKNDWGFAMSRVNISVKNDAGEQTEGRLSISAVIKENFASLTEEELANAPIIAFENQTFEFGNINQGDVVEHEYKFTNNGKRDLIIRKTKASCGCTAIMPTDNIIAPGKSSSINMKFNSRGKKGAQNKNITVYSNDPKNSEIKLRIKGTVNVQ
jgi:uncharacterized protein DUF1573